MSHRISKDRAISRALHAAREDPAVDELPSAPNPAPGRTTRLTNQKGRRICTHCMFFVSSGRDEDRGMAAPAMWGGNRIRSTTPFAQNRSWCLRERYVPALPGYQRPMCSLYTPSHRNVKMTVNFLTGKCQREPEGLGPSAPDWPWRAASRSDDSAACRTFASRNVTAMLKLLCGYPMNSDMVALCVRKSKQWRKWRVAGQ